MLSKRFNILIVLLMMCFILPSSLQSIALQPMFTSRTLNTSQIPYSTNNIDTIATLYHNPINITNNSELAGMATTGNGSKTNPYIINNLIINTCTVNETGIKIQNTNKYFVLRNITVSGCAIGILLSNVSFGTIRESFVTNYPNIGFALGNSSNNNLIDDRASNSTYDQNFGYPVGFSVTAYSFKNSIIDCAVNNSYYGFAVTWFSTYNNLRNNKASDTNKAGFDIYRNSSYNILANNIVNNYIVTGFNLYWYSNNNLLLNNTVTNGGWGFEVGGTSYNNILENNVGIYNAIDFEPGSYNTNTSLINNKFIIIGVSGVDQSNLAYSFPLTLTSPITLLSIIVLLGIYSEIGYNYYNFKKMRKKAEKSKGKNKYIISDQGGIIVLFSLINFLLVTISLLPSTSFITANISTNYFSPNSGIFQLAPLSGILLLGGEIISLLGAIICPLTESFNKWKIAKETALIGLSTQIMGLILSILVYFGIIFSIFNLSNTVKVSGTFSYTVLPAIGFILCIFGIGSGYLSYFLQRNNIS